IGIENRQLRFFSPDSVLVPTPEESATEAQRQLGSVQNELITTQNQLEIERHQKDQLAVKLRELGIDPEQL
ncbi:MAG: Uma2 family endonuclease, partial [Limnospira sp. PMC 1286.21]|nr:Uma2 family endonuclease [Limnospira sp. PMC 1249.20]MDT9272948.1 Uma2 family endonuclease [Limnospira sp. PMC 1234.20]MDT9329162.1 Uma2 family endonuclease [Limnospira sp. PMC 1286.21]